MLLEIYTKLLLLSSVATKKLEANIVLLDVLIPSFNNILLLLRAHKLNLLL
jgi:hypothetical protein